MQPNLQLLTPDEAAKMLGLSKRHLLQLPIRRMRFGHRTIRFRAEDVQDFLERRGRDGDFGPKPLPGV